MDFTSFKAKLSSKAFLRWLLLMLKVTGICLMATFVFGWFDNLVTRNVVGWTAMGVFLVAIIIDQNFYDPNPTRSFVNSGFGVPSTPPSSLRDATSPSQVEGEEQADGVT